MVRTFDELLAQASALRGRRVAVAAPQSDDMFAAVRAATEALGVRCTLTGPRADVERGLAAAGLAAGMADIADAADTAAAVRAAIDLAREGRADILMKGSVDTGTLLRAVLDERAGLRTGRLLSDVFLTEYRAGEESRILMITDGGITLAPDLKEKVELVRNAVEVAHALGNATPRVAVLSATEFVLPSLPSTIDAAALAKMSDRGQIAGCVIDGPLALDNALSAAAAREKRLSSPVAGRADILLAPGIEAANSLAKSTTYFAGLRLAHVVVGGRIPILIPSRADGADARLLSIALGVLMSAHAGTGR